MEERTCIVQIYKPGASIRYVFQSICGITFFSPYRILLSNPLDPLSRSSGALTRTISGSLPLASLQRNMPSHFHNENLPSGVALSFLESQVSASTILQSGTEFRHWLLATVNHLLEKGLFKVFV